MRCILGEMGPQVQIMPEIRLMVDTGGIVSVSSKTIGLKIKSLSIRPDTNFAFTVPQRYCH